MEHLGRGRPFSTQGVSLESRSRVLPMHDPTTHDPTATSAPAPTEHPSIASFRRAWRAKGGAGELVVADTPTATAADAAAVHGVEVGAIANSLVFDAGGRPVLILTSGAHRVDTTKVSADLAGDLTGAGLKRATPEFVREHTGHVIGGVSPFDHPGPIATYLDRALARYPVIWAAAGHPAASFSTTYDELLAMTAAVEIDVE